MGHVRPFEEKDIPQVADLHRRVFRTDEGPSRPAAKSYPAYFQTVYLTNPWSDPQIPSLVYENSTGVILGFLGVVPRPMSLRGRPLTAAVSSQFIVEPGDGSGMIAVHLAKTFLSGPQDLSLADEAGMATRKLCESLGGTTVLLYSLYWGRLLRPCQFGLSRCTRHRLLTPVKWAFGPLCRAADALAARFPLSPFRQSAPSVVGEVLTGGTLLTCLSECVGDWALRPEYDDQSLTWLLEVLTEKSGHGVLHPVLVRNAEGERIGWYLYYQNPGGLGEVIQIGAKRRWTREVLAHLFHHAWRHGVAALSGRLEPSLIQELSEQSCFFHHRGFWVLAHSRKNEIVQTILRGDAYLTRLEGEWALRF